VKDTEDCIKELADNSNFVVYGAPEHAHLWNYINTSYMAYIPSDGKSFLEKSSEHGITLALHSKWHLDNKAPSARVFEGVASSTIIISDSHDFVKEKFGDFVLYFNHSLDSEGMFQQISVHLSWIKNNPELALQKAKKAHEIFTSNFTLEKQLGILKDSSDTSFNNSIA